MYFPCQSLDACIIINNTNHVRFQSLHFTVRRATKLCVRIIMYFPFGKFTKRKLRNRHQASWNSSVPAVCDYIEKLKRGKSTTQKWTLKDVADFQHFLKLIKFTILFNSISLDQFRYLIEYINSFIGFYVYLRLRRGLKSLRASKKSVICSCTTDKFFQ